MLVKLTREEINLILTWASFYDIPREEDVDLMDKFETILHELDEDED